MKRKHIALSTILLLLIFIFSCSNDMDMDQEESLGNSYVEKDTIVDKDSIRLKETLYNDKMEMLTSEGTLPDSRYTSIYIRNVYILTGSSSSILPPVPYIKVNRGYMGYGNGDLNQGAGGKYIYLCYSRESYTGNPLRGFYIHSGGKTHYPASGWFHVSNSNGYGPYGSRGADLNKGSGGDYIYLLSTRGTSKGSPIREVGIISTTYPVYYAPAGWNIILKDLNKGAGGKYIYLIYKN